MKHSIFLTLIVLAGLAGAGISCVEQSSPDPAATASTPGDPNDAPQVYQVKGTIMDVIPEKNRLRIAHEEIPDYMAAMTMLFDVKDPDELNGLAKGDLVHFRMLVTKTDGWIDQVTKVGTTNLNTEVPGKFRQVRDVDPLVEGDLMPNYELIDETGQAVSLQDFKGRPYAFTFIFTRCPFPTFCPRMSSQMQAVYQRLKENPDAPKGWHLFSITIDPEFDVPEVLKSYAQQYTYDPKRWNYLTGKLIDLTAITEQFGLQFYRPDPNQPTSLTHNLRTVVVDAEGKVAKILMGNEWKSEELYQALLDAAAAQ